ncbi:MAG: PAC2 family protein [Candidatus Bathyarchaeota archaeon]|nr:PAC2 family protein [Candidatus Bathyarchaeota archaeon]
MDVKYLAKPKLKEPTMIAAWPGMGYLAKISADYLRRRLKATLFAEIMYYHNVLIYDEEGKADLAPIKHKLYASEEYDLIICVGDAQPSIPEESLRLAEGIADIAVKYNVKQVYSMAAFPNDFYEEPQVYGVYTDDSLRTSLEEAGVKLLDTEGAVNGLNGVIIGIAQLKGIKGVCLMGDITYANVPQHLSSKAVLEVLSHLLTLDIDTEQLRIRAEKIDASIKKRLDIYQDEDDIIIPEEKRLGYIS